MTPRVAGSLILSLAFVLLPGCSRCGKKTVDAAPRPAFVQAPYTAEELRAALKTGTTYEFTVRSIGKQEERRVMTFLNNTEQGTDVQGVTLDGRGGVVEPPKITNITWEQMRAQTEFPVPDTTVREERVTLPVGLVECKHYAVTEGTGADAKVNHFLFAKTMPGPAVQFYTEQGKTRLMTTTLMKVRPPGGR